MIKNIGYRPHTGEKDKFAETAMIGSLNFESKAKATIVGWRCIFESHW